MYVEDVQLITLPVEDTEVVMISVDSAVSDVMPVDGVEGITETGVTSDDIEAGILTKFASDESSLLSGHVRAMTLPIGMSPLDEGIVEALDDE